MDGENPQKKAAIEPVWAALDPREARKRRRERSAILLLFILLVVLTAVEFGLTRVSRTLPLVNSIFF